LRRLTRGLARYYDRKALFALRRPLCPGPRGPRYFMK
jgi:hypothetical protein